MTPILISNREQAAMSDNHLSHITTSEYSYRVPTPPRIIIPPPVLNPHNEQPLFSFEHGTNANLDFLAAYDLSQGSLVKSNIMNEWRYEKRRQAQEILPFLWLGPMSAAKDRNFLHKEGITMVFAVTHKSALQSKLLNGALRVAIQEGVEPQSIEVADNAGLIAAFPSATTRINAHLSGIYRGSGGQTQGKVLVFCESGNERSAAVVAAYMMEIFNDVNHLAAMSIAQSQRFCVNFDDPLKHLLLAYWDLVTARRDVTAARPSLNANYVDSGTMLVNAQESNHPAKRRVGDDEDDGMEVDDEARFDGRRAFTPFQDNNT